MFRAILLIASLLPAVALAAPPAPAGDKARAVSAVKAILQINLPGERPRLEVREEKSIGDGAGTLSTFTIAAHTVDRRGRANSAEFEYAVQVVNNAVWSLQASCKDCQ